MVSDLEKQRDWMQGSRHTKASHAQQYNFFTKLLFSELYCHDTASTDGFIVLPLPWPIR